MEQLTAEELLRSIWAALRRIEDNLALPPAPLEIPPINVTPPDLTEVVTAVTSLRPSATADDIARALADVLSPRSDDGAGDALRQVAEGLKTLDHRLQGFGKQAYGGGSAIIDKNSVAAAGLAKETTLESLRADVADGISVAEAGPAPVDILVGHLAHTATTAAATVITIPINRIWRGTIEITCDGANAAADTAAGQALGVVTTTGASVLPAAGTVASCEARWGANSATGTVGSQGANSMAVPMVVSAGASAPATIALASTIVGTNGRVACIASGVLV